MEAARNGFLRHRLSRRQLLGGMAGSALGAAGLALACGDGGGPSGAVGTPGGTPKRGGIYRVRQAVALPNMNPFQPGLGSLVQGLFLGFTVFDHLWYVPTDTGTVEKFLATEIEQIDELTVNVTMGDGFFHNKPPVNGRKVTVQDIKASVERFRSVPPILFSWLHHIFERMDTPDERTVVYHQNRPWAWFYTSSNAGSPISSSILPEEILDDEDLLNRDAIGSGRWVLASHDNGINIRLSKFENWREPGLPYLDGTENLFYSEDAGAIAAFSAQDIDSLDGLTRLDVDNLVSRFGDDIVTDSDLSRQFRTLNLKYEPPFTDERVRQGINLILNRDELRALLNDGDGEFSGPLPPAHQRYVLPEDDPDMQEYFRHDLEEGKALLQAADFPFDQEFQLKHSDTGDSPQLAQFVADQLRAADIKVRLVPEPLDNWLVSLFTGNFQMTSYTHLPYEDPDLPLRFYISSQAEHNNFMNYKDEEVDAALLAAAQELDEERRVQLVQDAQRLLIRKYAPQLNLFSPITHGARWSYVQGVVTGRGSYGLFNSRVWLDK